MNIHIIQHVPFEPAGMITDWANLHHYSLTHSFLFEKKIYWPPVDDLDMLVIMGGPMGVNEEDKFEWLKEEKSFIKDVVAANKIVLGICLGSQLLAEALGAKVYSNSQKEIGFFPVTKTTAGTQDEIFANVPETWNVLHWHGDTFDLPEGASHLYTSAACKHQVFRKGNSTGIQFHPEADAGLLESMIANEKHELIKAKYVQTEEEIRDVTITGQNRIHLYEILARLTQKK